MSNLLKPLPGILPANSHPTMRGRGATWFVNEGGGTTINDLTGLNPGTLVGGPTWTAGKFGSALKFNGSTAFVSFGDTLSLQGDKTLSIWVKTAPGAVQVGTYISKWSGGYGLNFILWSYSGDIKFGDSYSSRLILTGGEYLINDGNWHHLAAVIAGSTGYIYIDGILRTSGGGFTNTFSTESLVIGAYDVHSSPSLPFTGSLDILVVKEYAMNQGEILELYTNPFGVANRRWIIQVGGVTDTPVDPGVGTIALTGNNPTLVQTANQAIAPGVGSFVFAGNAPTVTYTANQAIVPSFGNVSLTGNSPTVAQTANQWIVPDAGNVSFAGNVPSISQTANQWIVPDVGSVSFTGNAPSVQQSVAETVFADTGLLIFGGYAPVVARTAHQSITPGVGSVAFTGNVPNVLVRVFVAPGVGNLAFTGNSPSIQQTANRIVTPNVGLIAFIGLSPTVARSVHQTVIPGVGAFTIVRYSPTVFQGGVSANFGEGFFEML